MYWLNKIVWFFLNPVALIVVSSVAGLVLAVRRRRIGVIVLSLAVAALWFASTPLCVCLLGLPLEKPYFASQTVECLPEADAIVLLGGGIGKADELAYPDMFAGADRVWHAARLWKARKAPIIVTSGTSDESAAVPLLVEFGVPREAIVVECESRNTYENSRFTEKLLSARGDGRCRVLLVTSAWHMTRALGNFTKTSLSVVPAACDFSAHAAWFDDRYPWGWVSPCADSLSLTNVFLKEWIGRLARR